MPTSLINHHLGLIYDFFDRLISSAMITGKSRILPTLGFPKPTSTLLLSAKSRKNPRRSQVSTNHQPSFFLLFLGPRHSPRNGESVRQRTPPQSRTLFSPSPFPRTSCLVAPPHRRARGRAAFHSSYSTLLDPESSSTRGTPPPPLYYWLPCVGGAVEWGSVRTFFLSLVRKHWVAWMDYCIVQSVSSVVQELASLVCSRAMEPESCWPG